MSSQADAIMNRSVVRKSPKFYIETNALYGVECSDEGRYYNYDNFITEGDTFEQLLDNCSGFKMDQDGGEGPEVMYWDLPDRLQTILNVALLDQFLEQGGRI